MKSLFLQKLYFIRQKRFYALFLSLLLFEALLVVLELLFPSFQADHWVTCGMLCILMIALTNGSHKPWATYLAVMPITKRQIVLMEYLFLSGSAILYTLIFSCFPLIVMLRSGTFDGGMLLFGTVSVFSVSILLFLLMIPINFIFGKKGLMILMIAAFILMIVISFCSAAFENFLLQAEKFILSHNLYLIALSELLVITLLTLISCFLTSHFYLKKESEE